MGLCFASGLSPIAGVYGPVAGMVAGAMHYFLVTSVPLIQGGFNLYNGGFSAALVCLVLVPVLECYTGIGEERLEKRAQEIQENAIKKAAPRE